MEAEFTAQPPTADDDFCAAVLSKFSSSTATNEHHNHVCAAVGATSQELRDQNLPLTPVSYFGATCASLDELAASHDPPGHVVDALINVLSMAFDAVPAAVLRKKHDYLSELLVRVLKVKTVRENGVNPGLKCVARLVVLNEKAEWASVAQLCGMVVGYMTDDRIKVRKQSHSCLREILEYFQSVPLLAPLLTSASESITNVFERFLLLAGGSNANISEGPKGAQEVLYILDALKLCLPCLSSKSLTNIMKYFKSLLDLKHPLVTRRIADGLNSLCLQSTGEVSAETLLDLLCTLAASLSTNESSADSMTFTVRLLDVGIRKVYLLNRQHCVVKIPVIFSSLKDVLTSGHEEALVAAVATFKSLINSCIDDNLVKQGVDQVTISTTRKSGPTVMEKVCATIESLLDHHYEEVWDMSFQIVSTMFDKLGKLSFYFLKQTVEILAEIQKLPDEDFAFRKELHECMGTALGAMGAEKFLSILPLHLEAQILSEANLWLFPILKQFIVGDHLVFFTEAILPIIREMKQKSYALEQGGKIHSARNVDGIVYSLWSLLPSFCNYPVDTAESFKGMEKILCTALTEEPDVRGILCSSFQILVQQNKRIMEGEENGRSEISMPEKRAIALYTSQVASANLTVLKSSARELLSVLTGVYFKSSKDTAGILQSAIGEISSISDKEVVARFFKKTMQKLLKVTQDAGKLGNSTNANNMQVDNPSNDGSLSIARTQLFDLAVSFLPGLDSKEIDLLFVAISPSLKDSDGMIQKRAYRVLSLIFQKSDDFISRKLDTVLNLMIEVLPACHFSAKRYRLDCLYFLIVHISKDGTEQMRRDVVASFLTEIVLALKEANKKTRNRAYDILVQIGHACGDEDKGGEKEKLLQFFNMVAGGLAGESSHMISAAMTGLARLAYEFYDLVSAAYNVLPSTFLLLQRNNKEVIRANLGLLKVLVAKSPAERLKNHLQSIVEGLLNWQDSTRNHFKAKVKLLIEMLVKKCGVEAVKQVMPEEHMKLLTNIRKINERNERKQYAKSVENRSVASKATTSRLSRWNHTKIFSDFEDEDTMISAGENENAKSIRSRRSKHPSELQSKALLPRSKKRRRAAKSLQEDLFDEMDDEPLDLLDSQRMRSSLRSSEVRRKNPDSDDELEIDSEGRLLIREDDGKKRAVDRKQKQDNMPLDSDDERSELKSNLSTSSKRNQKRRKTTESGWSYTGKEYASKKASGDVKRKDKLEPYAYWPLDRKMVSKRPEHRAAARKGMASVVKLTKKLEGKSVALSLKGLAMKKGKKKASSLKKR